MSTDQCLRCGVVLEGSSNRSICPSCGSTPKQESSLIQKYFSTLQEILFQPSLFFKSWAENNSITSSAINMPLAFALVTHWFGSTLSFLWRELLMGESPHQMLWLNRFFGSSEDQDLIHSFQNKMTHWMWGVGPVLLDPFITLFWILVTSCLIFVGARLLSPSAKNSYSAPVTFESSLQIVCFSMGTAIFTALPWVGGLIYALWFPILLIIGARVVYRLSTGRAILVALFPNLFFLGIILIGILLFTIGALKFISAFL